MAHAAGVDSSAALVDVTDGTLYDGWGRAAVETLSAYDYSYDASGNVESIAVTSGTGGQLMPGLLPESPAASTFARSGSDQLSAAVLASSEDLGFTYDANYGQVTAIADGEASGYSLSFEADRWSLMAASL